MFKLLTSAVFMILTLISPGQNFSGGFHFRLPPTDSTSQYFLPAFENAITDDTSFVKSDGHGHFTIHGKPVKFFGFNMGTLSIPDKEVADRFIGRLCKMGVNMVRLGFDNSTRRGIFYNVPTRILNQTNLDKLDYFVSRLKKNGIYIHLTLMVSRMYQKEDGFPEADSIWRDNMTISMFDPWLIFLQKEYQNNLLLHVNPYTGKSLAKDPVLATLDIIMETNLIWRWQSDQLVHYSEGGWLTYRHTRMLDSLWNKFLAQKYKTRDNLLTGWGSASGFTNPEMFLNGGFEEPDINRAWNVILVENAKAVLTKDTTLFHTGKASAKIEVTGHDGTNWHIMFIQNNLSFRKDSDYTVELCVKADRNTTIQINVSRDNFPYTLYGAQQFKITTGWQKIKLIVRAKEDNDKQGDITINPFDNCTLWIDDISMKKVIPTGLTGGEDFNQFTIKRINYIDRRQYTNNRVCDQLEFYIKTMADYYEEINNHLKKSIGLKALVTGSNNLVGAEDLMAEKNMDFIDEHGYWDTPVIDWVTPSLSDWSILNTPMIKNDSMNTLNNLFSGIQAKGKPFTITEYNHPFPNRYQTEGIPMVTGYASFQGADMILFCFYNHSFPVDADPVWNNDFVPPWGFSLDQNNAMMVQMPVYAYAFRKGLISEADKSIEFSFAPRDIYLMEKKKEMLPYPLRTISNFFSQKYGLAHKVITASTEASQTTNITALPPVPVSPFHSSTGQLQWDTTGIFTIETDKLINFTGFLFQFPNRSLKNATLVSADKFGIITWLALDDTPLSKSRKSLITLSTRQQNTGMIWDGIHTVHNNWGTAPTEIEPMKVTLQLSIDADSVRIFPMDTIGGYKPNRFKAYKPESPGKFRITLDMGKDKTCWYGMKAYIKGMGPTGIEPVKITETVELTAYPNPVSGKATIRYCLPGTGDTEIKIYDLLGREVYHSQRQKETAGQHEIEIDVAGLQTGVYISMLRFNNMIYKSKMVVMK